MNAPSSDIDLLTPQAIADPHATFAALRKLGPIVWLTRHRAWLFTTHEAVRLGFHDQRLSSDRLTPLEARLDERTRVAMGQTFELLRCRHPLFALEPVVVALFQPTVSGVGIDPVVEKVYCIRITLAQTEGFSSGRECLVEGH